MSQSRVLLVQLQFARPCFPPALLSFLLPPSSLPPPSLLPPFSLPPPFLLLLLGHRSSGDAPQIREFDRLLLILHYYATRGIARKHGLEEVVAKLSVSLLRFLDPIPVDR